MQDTNNEPVAPVIEKFFDVPYKYYCGSCERLMTITGKYFLDKDVRERIKVCKWCGRPIKWEK